MAGEEIKQRMRADMPVVS